MGSTGLIKQRNNAAAHHGIKSYFRNILGKLGSKGVKYIEIIFKKKILETSIQDWSF
jgi:hypothetical protein